MSSNFMFFIAAMYIAAAFFFGCEGRWVWAGVALCWGIGNALIGSLSLEH